MRLACLAVVLLAATALGAGCTSAPDHASYQRHGFAFDYPAGWNLSEERDPDGGYTLTLDAGGGSGLTVSTTPNLSAQYPPTERLDTLGVWYAESRARLLSVDASVIEEREESLSGEPARRIVYAVRRDGTGFRGTLVVAAIGDTGYSLTLFAPPGDHDALLDELETVLASFRVDGTA
jgi:hypothetical protein